MLRGKEQPKPSVRLLNKSRQLRIRSGTPDRSCGKTYALPGCSGIAVHGTPSILKVVAALSGKF